LGLLKRSLGFSFLLGSSSSCLIFLGSSGFLGLGIGGSLMWFEKQKAKLSIRVFISYLPIVRAATYLLLGGVLSSSILLSGGKSFLLSLDLGVGLC
jgi:hypothetical protein